jgi:hypothetical protein
VRRPAIRPLLAGALVVASLAACSDEDTGTPRSTTTTEDAGTVAPPDPTLVELLLSEADLPDGFAPSADVDDTVTTFCAGQDAAAGLSASGRAIAAFTRTPAGASVIEVVFRFERDGAARFVEQADELLTSCDGVPDATGLAFTYEPLGDAVAATLEGATASAGRYGTSVGSGDLTVQVAVARHDDLGVLVAVLGLEQSRADLDALAAAAFAAALDKLG